MIKNILTATLAVLVISGLAQQATALAPDFVPAGVSLTSIDISQVTWNRFYTSGDDTTSTFYVLRKRAGVDEEDVSGSVSYSLTTAIVHYQYGLFDTINLGISVPWVSSSRSATVNQIDPAASDFADTISDADATGVGDIELSALWQPLLNDVTDLNLGLILNGDNGSYYGDDNEKMALGSGTNEVSFYLRLRMYSIHSKLNMSLELEYQFTFEGTVKTTDDNTVTKSRDNYGSAIMDLAYEMGAFGYGGGLHVESEGATKLDGDSLENGYLGYSLRGFLSFGNLHLLENQVVNRPWEVKLLAEKTMAGSNAPEFQKLSVRLSTFF